MTSNTRLLAALKLLLAISLIAWGRPALATPLPGNPPPIADNPLPSVEADDYVKAINKEPMAFDDRLLHIEGRFGLGALTGLAGGVVGLNLDDRIVLGGGAGVTVSWITAAFLRLRPYISHSHTSLSALAFEFGYSYSPRSSVAEQTVFGETTRRGGQLLDVHWLHLDVGWEHRSRGSTNIRFTGGLAAAQGVFIPTFTFGVGY